MICFLNQYSLRLHTMHFEGFHLPVTYLWFRLDVPVILRNSEEADSLSVVSKKQMRQVKNPFGLDITNPDAASITSGISLTPNCLENCMLTCYWGCSVQRLQEALQHHLYCFLIKSPTALENVLYGEYLHKEQHVVQKHGKEEIYTQLPPDSQLEDFGSLPRTHYPLVAFLTLSDEEDRESYDIVSMLAVIHIPDRCYRLPCRIMYQYLLTSQGQFYDLKQLFMSANDYQLQSTSDSSSQDSTADKDLLEKFGLSEEDVQEDNAKDCVVCQNGTVNWVLLPCRHVCLCDGCLRYFQHCPICRQFVQESFPLCSQSSPTSDGSSPIEED
ncbi:cell growth regulator with RING finger domain protein 1 isoform X2 [Xenopus tropicalis]|uniref:Cell growth regulator with RING finger domain protein 1 n=1 Tax=Xenopus tropicalis TaxID=8364 RepID=A0A8J1ILV0_XENTR|nr:cell growth regulator with RING finger domain protein 1 isoform X2 [Xenopus tropicalis]